MKIDDCLQSQFLLGSIQFTAIISGAAFFWFFNELQVELITLIFSA